MASNRLDRINEEIQRTLAEKIRALKDPRVQGCMLSLTAVRTTPDLRYAKVYVSVLEKEKARDALRGLRSAGGFLRREIAGELRLRCVPELVFEEDDSIAYGAHMSALIDALNHPKEEENADRS